MKRYLLIIILLSGVNFCSFSQSTTWATQFSDAIISRYQPTINNMTSKGWEYSNGIVLHGMEKVYNKTNDADYFNYIKAYIDTYVDANGNVSDLDKTVDKIQPGILCLFLYEKTGQLKYKTAATNLKNYLFNSTNFYRTPDGGFWHKSQSAINTTSYAYHHVMMVDGMYMLHPFLAKYASIFNEPALFDEVTFQLLYMAQKVMPSPANLPRHAWEYYDFKTWSDPVTHKSTDVWSRGTGWYMMALTDVLQYLPKTHTSYAAVLEVFQRMSAGVAATQDATTGLWYQVMDKPSTSGNWLESSGSGMFVYALKKGVNYGWLSGATYNTIINNGWTGMKTQIANYTDNKPQIKQFCIATGVVNTTTDYINLAKANVPTPSGTQHPHGYCSILMASSAMEFSFTNQPPSISIATPSSGAGFTAPASMNITVNSTDPDGAIEKVEFYQGATKIGEDILAPFTFQWSGVASGAYSITAKATDNMNATTTSEPVDVNVAGLAQVFSQRILSGNDDAEEFSSDGRVTRTSYIIEMSYYSTFTGDQVTGFRFDNVTIPKNANITRAYIEFSAWGVNTGDAALNIWGELTGTSQPFEITSLNITNRTKTSASVSWNPPAWNAVNDNGAAQQTPDLKTIVQQIIGTSGWVSGGPITFILSGTGIRKAYSYETDPQKSAKLVMEYN